MHTNIAPAPIRIGQRAYDKLVKTADRVERHAFQDGVHEVAILNNKPIAFSETIEFTEYYKVRN
ncbi:MAG: hypothetical protein ACRC3J_09155 [Culicoidibacterales bacterium]